MQTDWKAKGFKSLLETSFWQNKDNFLGRKIMCNEPLSKGKSCQTLKNLWVNRIFHDLVSVNAPKNRKEGYMGMDWSKLLAKIDTKSLGKTAAR